MDLGIAGRRAIVCAASAGLGRGTALALAKEDVRVLIVARDAARLGRAAADMAEVSGGGVDFIAADVTTEEGREAILGRLPDPDILINNAGGPPTGDFRSWDRDVWIRALDANMLSAIFMIKAVVDAMIARKFGRIVNITSSMVKSPAGYLGLSNGARAGLTGFVGGLAREIAAHNVTVNNVLPGQFDTDRLRGNHRALAAARGLEVDAVREGARLAIPAKRFGEPDEFGAACAFLCSAQAGFITGQNLLLDGGQFPGLL